MTGVLPVATGRATRIVQALLKAGKEYVCLMHLHKEVSEKEIRDIFKKFKGKIKQIPPVRSAVKREEREREIYYLEILEIDGQDVLFKVGCEAGTYIRKICLHPLTEIISRDSVILAEDFFVNPTKVYSMDNKKIVQKSPSETQKFNFRGNLINFTMSSGITFSVTPEHRMLISSENGYIMKPASRIKTSDYIVKSLSYNVPEKNPAISDLLDDAYLVDQEDIKDLVKNTFIQQYGSIRGMYRKLKLDRKAFLKNSKNSIPLSHIKKAGIYEKVKHSLYGFKTEKGKKIKLLKLNSDLMYLLGLIASDGNNTKEKGTVRHTRIKFHNKNKKLVEIFLKKYKRLFPNFNITESNFRDLIQLDTSNSFLATLCASLGVKSPQKNSDLLPILYLNKNLIATLLRGYFDGDGSAYYKIKLKGKGISTNIAFHTGNAVDAKRLHQMLLKLDISNYISKRKIRCCNKVSTIYDVKLSDMASKKKFISEIGSNHPLKKEKLKLIKKLKSNEIKDNLYMGLHYKKYLEENKLKLRSLGGNLNRIIGSNIPVTRRTYKLAKKLVNLPLLDEFHIEKVKSIELAKYNGPIYDMTVPETHNFLIETGFVSSNCSDFGEKLGCGAHMSQLIRTKAGPFNYHSWVSLHDLKDAYEEEGLKEVVYPVEKGVEHLAKIWILDNAVDSLCHGANLSIPGISKLDDDISKGDLVAVLTLKGELVCLGEAYLGSGEISKKDKGLAVNVKKVFMERGVYSR